MVLIKGDLVSDKRSYCKKIGERILNEFDSSSPCKNMTNGSSSTSPALTSGYSYVRIEAIAKYIKSKTKFIPKVGIICGSGLGGLADQLDKKEIIKYESIPDFPRSTVAGHAGCLVFGYIDHVPIVCMKGRFHSYEGHPAWLCALPVRVMKLLGIELIIVTNAAGGLNPQFKAGDIMIIDDHIGFPALTGESALRGENDERWGPRFPALTGAYDPELCKTVMSCSKKLRMDSIMRKGVYFMSAGPCYETIAETRMIRMLGADAVGMSTVHEVTVARHASLRVIGLSLITNMCIIDPDNKCHTNHEEVLEMANIRAKEMEKLVRDVILTVFPKPKPDAKTDSKK
ncbi:purine nucleoside phosphorylase-like isoform X2 [Brevipalpus obovatus]|uniref:purine nucleoside phosphorylase-like isoform X2 n=1 Tax=Brevipalpus obovatus TaxID=246614 RepID=UPI003D9F651D